jgi:hypothetical protein
MNAMHEPVCTAWKTAGKIFWTFLALFFPFVIAEGTSGWMALLAFLHSAWFLRLVWMNPND